MNIFNTLISKLFGINKPAIGRQEYLFAYLELLFGIFVFAFISSFISDQSRFSAYVNVVYAIVGLLLAYVALYVLVVGTVRRLRDIHWNTYLACLIFVPLVSFIFMITLCFIKGPND